MSLQDFALGVLASICAALICRLSTYVRPHLKKFLALTRASAERFHLIFIKLCPPRSKSARISHERTFSFFPNLRLPVLFTLVIMFVPLALTVTTEDDTDQSFCDSLRSRERDQSLQAEIERLRTDPRAIEKLALARLRAPRPDDIIVPIE